MRREAIAAAFGEKSRILYEGRLTPHRSCGVAVAEAFDRRAPAYHALCRGGFDGQGQCGAIVAGQLLLGELLGPTDSTAPTAPALASALARYRRDVAARVVPGAAPSQRCRELTERFPCFASEERADFCAEIAAGVAQLVAELAQGHGASLTPVAIPGLPRLLVVSHEAGARPVLACAWSARAG